MTEATIYDWQEQLEKGVEWENRLDTYFKHWYHIRPASIEEQWQGIDRIFRPKEQDERLIRTEYKSDFLTQHTGNIFCETYSNVDLGRYGWAWSSRADILVYFTYPKTLYIVKPTEIRDHIMPWQERYGTRDVQNKGYQSRGIPVPREVFAKICERIIRLK